MTAWRSCVPLLALLACGGRATGSDFETERTESAEGAVTTARATWKYVSGDVDVTASLLTERGTSYCTTNALLTIDKANAAPESYRLERADCSVLALTDAGDIVLYDSPTGHDWSPEPLRVDTEQELIELGPWTPAEAGTPTYRFTLAAPPCGGDCSCPFLRRRAGSEDLVLELDRACD